MKKQLVQPKCNPKDYFLVRYNGKPLQYQHFNTWMKNVIRILNFKLRTKMNPKHYTPHVLRVGGCTDRARNGEQGWQIEKFGRWSSKVWKDTYINLDWSDLAILLNTTQTALQSRITTRPYVD